MVGPLTSEQLQTNAKKLNEKASTLGGPPPFGDHTYAWVLAKARRLKVPVPYVHPRGAVLRG